MLLHRRFRHWLHKPSWRLEQFVLALGIGILCLLIPLSIASACGSGPGEVSCPSGWSCSTTSEEIPGCRAAIDADIAANDKLIDEKKDKKREHQDKIDCHNADIFQLDCQKKKLNDLKSPLDTRLNKLTPIKNTLDAIQKKHGSRDGDVLRDFSQAADDLAQLHSIQANRLANAIAAGTDWINRLLEAANCLEQGALDMCATGQETEDQIRARCALLTDYVDDTDNAPKLVCKAGIFSGPGCKTLLVPQAWDLYPGDTEKAVNCEDCSSPLIRGSSIGWCDVAAFGCPKGPGCKSGGGGGGGGSGPVCVPGCIGPGTWLETDCSTSWDPTC